MMHQKQTCEQQLENLRQEYEEFAYLVSHDLKAPLRAINNLSAWIEEDLGDDLAPDIQKNIQLLQQRTDRMERMISGLLDFSRITRYDLNINEVNVQELVQHLADQIAHGSPLEVHASGLPTLTTYAKKLETVFRLLLQNAAKFNQSAKPQVWITAQEQEEAFLFTVKDNGIGISTEAQEKVFKMFYSVQPKEHNEGIGAGLAIARKIIQFVGGTIRVQSTLGQGAEFSFLWPKHV
ncbi:sensor histidine kinase [Rufibacter latericius]|uniref:histidine kinase n=1 Tax=Rufibacter latericius TaxID=2487040 RepID=A0A3M9MCZ4_9BACT|nr:HAMP domain-containing sensor histidine kinase [Rufibacter latericius]RNI22468.1 sensor histidine kinase [Rufibacter latericius]